MVLQCRTELCEGASTGARLTLANYAFNQVTGTTPKDTVPGLRPDEIALLGKLHGDYDDADWAQSKARRAVEQALDTLAPLHRKFENKADLAFPHTDKSNRTIRKSLGLPAGQARDRDDSHCKIKRISALTRFFALRLRGKPKSGSPTPNDGLVRPARQSGADREQSRSSPFVFLPAEKSPARNQTTK